MKKLVEVIGIFRRERYRGSTTMIIECDLPPSPKVEAEAAIDIFDINPFDVEPGIVVEIELDKEDFIPSLSYRFYGRWKEYTNRRTQKTEKQFFARTVVRCQPHGMAGVIRYLSQVQGIGTAIARQLWDQFRGDAVQVLRQSPHIAAAACPKLRDEVAARAAKWLANEIALEGCTIDLMDLLTGKGFPRDLGKLLTQDFGNRAYEIVQRNPWLLLLRYKRCTFTKCDQLYLDLQGNPARLKRQALCMWEAAKKPESKELSGHTWVPVKTVAQALNKKIGGTRVRMEKAGQLAVRAKRVARWPEEGQGRVQYLADYTRAKHERQLAEIVARMLTDPVRWPDVSRIDASEHQREQLAISFSRSIGILTGTPGTGKTYTTARGVQAAIKIFGEHYIAICAPTGKAAVRLTETMNSYGLPMRAQTIHRLLGGTPDGRFKYGRHRLLPMKVVIVDEMSMADTSLFYALLSALPRGCHVLLVGDIGQLLPVGHGAPLRDLERAGVPTGRLTEIRRNSGRIVRACAQIRAGEKFQVSRQIDFATGENLKLLHASGTEEMIDMVSRAMRNLARQTHDGRPVDPVWDAQVIVATNKMRKELNKRLQRELNKSGQGVARCPFMTGDKITRRKNNTYLPIGEIDGKEIAPSEDADIDYSGDKPKVRIANGEIGRVLAVASEGAVVTAQFDAPYRVVKILRSKEAIEAADDREDDGSDDDGEEENKKTGTGCDFDLGYAITAHGSQGSEFLFNFVVLENAWGISTREWIYTATSRGKAACFLVGEYATAMQMVRKSVLDKRKTFLAELIREEVGRIQRPAAVAVGEGVKLEHESEVA